MAQLNATDSRGCVADYFKAPWWRRLFGTLSPQECVNIEVSSRESALLMWAMNVRQNAEWDHKPKIRLRFLATTHSRIFHAYDRNKYFYDIWSNIHYGYVGSAAGFDDSLLLDGAGLEQIGSDILRFRWPTRGVGVQGLRAFDDKPDRAAMSLGIELYQAVPDHISAHELVQTILMTDGLSVSPLP
jgi:hypothetical protein